MSLLLYNGTLLPAAAVALHLPNRGLQFNDGFFETLIWADGRVRYLPHHLHRMQRAATVLRLPLPLALANTEALTQTVRTLVEAQRLTSARVRVQLWRGGDGLYAPEPQAETCFVVTARPFVASEVLLQRVDIAREVWTTYSPLSFCKGPHAAQYVLAAQERQARGLDELLLLDSAGHVAESVSAAVFWVQANCLYTPALTTGCVAGVRRAHLLHVARAHGIRCAEGLFGLEVLRAADVVFTANVAGIHVVRNFGSSSLATRKRSLLTALRQWEAP